MLSKDYYIMKQNSRKGFLIPLYDISFPIFKTYTFLPFLIGRQTRPLGGGGVCVCMCVCMLGQEITTLLSMLGSHSFSETGGGD